MRNIPPTHDPLHNRRVSRFEPLQPIIESQVHSSTTDLELVSPTRPTSAPHHHNDLQHLKIYASPPPSITSPSSLPFQPPHMPPSSLTDAPPSSAPPPIVETIFEPTFHKVSHPNAIDLLSILKPHHLTGPPNDLVPASPPPNKAPSATVLIDEHESSSHFDSPACLPDEGSTLHSPLRDPHRIPVIPPSDKVSSTEPSNKIMTTEFLQKSVGFRNLDTLMKHLRSTSTDTITIRDTGRDPILSRGETATLPKRPRNTTPIPRPQHFGQVWHYDIVYGKGRAIGGFQYALFLVDRKTRFKFVFGLKDLSKPTITFQLKRFIRLIGKYPEAMLADRDFRLIGKAVDEVFEPHTLVSGAPGGRQSQNGLSEINWRYICNIARNYLAEHYLPSQFWFFAIRYAVQISNYLPITTTSSTTTTPFFEAYGTKPDYRKLSPLFSTSFVKIYSSAEGHTLSSQTIKAILVGNDEKSDGKLFYNPQTKQILASSDYRLNISEPSGPQFGLTYDGGPEYQLLTTSIESTSPAFDLGQEVFLSPTHPDHPSSKGIIINVPFDHNQPFTVQLSSSHNIVDVPTSELLPHDPTPSTSTLDPNPSEHHPWLRHHAKVTLMLPTSMPRPKQGFLVLKDKKWFFHPGRSLKSKSSRNNSKSEISLPDLLTLLPSLLTTKKLAPGWKQLKQFERDRQAALTSHYVARRVTFMQSSDPTNLLDDAVEAALEQFSPPSIIGFSKKVSAAGLHSLIEPKLHHHDTLSANDKTIWDKAYLEEYLGLHRDTETWEYITEDQYQQLRPLVGNALPSMAISKIKKDEKGQPSRAKYRIVVLGNLDPHSWASHDCFAPVLSPLELRLLISIAAHSKTVPKTGDVSQAFCQSVLPNDENYGIRPPKGCPLTPPKTLLLLKKTLYGLRRSPRHWYTTCRNALEKIGLYALPNAPCIFKGTLIDGEPPIYLGLFVDDFIYFSESEKVELYFETEFQTHFKVDFQGDIKHFLGINFESHFDPAGNLSIYMNQPTDASDLIQKTNLHNFATKPTPTPYRSGLPIDSVPEIDLPSHERNSLNTTLQELVGSLNWISTQTRPDLSTVTNLISQYNHNCSPGHIDSAKYAIRYLKGTAQRGICFSSADNPTIESFVKFPIDPSKLTPLTDANWGPQDQSVPKSDAPPPQLPLFKTRSLAGYIIWLGGPIHWSSKRQTFTARSSTEAEIGSVDECTKTIQYIRNILTDLGLFQLFTNGPIPIRNDNAAAVQWSHNMSTKGLRYIQIRENAVREQVQTGLITVEHIDGKANLADLFTKEDKDITHYQDIAEVLCPYPPSYNDTRHLSPHSEGGC